MKSYMHYVVEKKDGDWEWQNATFGALVPRGPKPVNGLVTLFGKEYAVDPSLNRRRYTRRFRPLRWPLEEHRYALFAEGVRVQVPFFIDFFRKINVDKAIAMGQPNITNEHLIRVERPFLEVAGRAKDAVAQKARLAVIRQFLSSEMNMMMVAVLLLGGIGIGAIVMSVIMKWQG